jgi:hypothetical protein
MKQEIAETAAMRALGWLVAREDLVEVFLGSTGAGAEDLRARAAEPEFLASVLDFILMDDAWVMDCATAIGMAPEQLVQCARRCPAAGCRTGRDHRKSPCGAKRSAGFARIPAPPAGASAPAASAALSLALKWSMFSTAERPRLDQAHLAFLGQRDGRGATVLAAHLARDQALILQLPQRAGGGRAVDADELGDLGGVLEALFLDGQEDAPAHARQAIGA